MNADSLKDELIELQRYKLQKLEESHERELDELWDVFGEIVKEIAPQELPLGAACVHNMKIILNVVKQNREVDEHK